jgi:NADPH:quinone reductase-like Zn-dependent oxidoreductase
MKAVGVTGPDFMPRLFDIDEPVAESDGVVVEVMAASVNDFDRAAVRGRHTSSRDQQCPVLLGRDFVGRVTAVGDDVDYVDVGMYVAGTLTPQALGQPGTFTDSVAVPAGLVAPVPDGIDLAHIAAVGLAGLTALDAISALGAARLGNLVIHGPLSEVGGFALQLAKAHGAVVAAITPSNQVEMARGLGADVVIPQSQDATQSIQAVRDFFGGGVDTAIHVAGELSVVAGVVRPGGQFPPHRHPCASHPPRRRLCPDNGRPQRPKAGGPPLQGGRAPSAQPCRPDPILRPGRQCGQSG